MGPKLRSLFGNFSDISQAPDLKATRVGQKRPIPTDEPVQPAHRAKNLYSRPQPEVIRITQNDLGIQIFRLQFFEPDTFDAAQRSYRHKYRGFDHGMPRSKSPCTGLAIGFNNVEGN
jgi:hypothetical protein